jgi:16S rRNA C1402 N4-methylase RsmH
MEQSEITLKFDDVTLCIEFTNALENHATRASDPFRIILPTGTQNMDNELLQLLITFMKNGGLLAIAAFINLLQEILKKLFPDKSVVIVRGKKRARITSKTTGDEAKRIARDFTSL